VQAILLMWMTIISYDNSRGTGWFCVESPRLRRWLRWFAYVYAGSMLLRYVIVMTFRPEMRWLHDTIPILFHFVLAGYAFALTVVSEKESNKNIVG
jgi:L-asparagine transporter-like permease